MVSRRDISIICIICVVCVCGVYSQTIVSETPRMTGAPIQSDKKMENALNDVRNSKEFKAASQQKAGYVVQRLEKGQLLGSWSQVVAGTNMKYLFKTELGFECFRIWVHFSGRWRKITRYATGEDKEKVFEECSSFRRPPSSEESIETRLFTTN